MAKRGAKPQTIEQIDEAIRSLREQRAARVKANREEEERREALRRTLLGGALIARASSGDQNARQTITSLVKTLSGRDAKPFEGWTIPAPPSTHPAPDGGATQRAGDPKSQAA